MNGGFPDSLLFVNLSDELMDGMIDFVSLCFSCEGHVNTVAFAIEIKPIFKQTDISCHLHMTVFIEIDPHEFFIS